MYPGMGINLDELKWIWDIQNVSWKNRDIWETWNENDKWLQRERNVAGTKTMPVTVVRWCAVARCCDQGLRLLDQTAVSDSNGWYVRDVVSVGYRISQCWGVARPWGHADNTHRKQRRANLPGTVDEWITSVILKSANRGQELSSMAGDQGWPGSTILLWKLPPRNTA